MDIQSVAISKINPAPYNPRKQLTAEHAKYRKLDHSLKEFGLVEPLIWNKRTGNLVGGHQRLRVPIDQGAIEVDVSVVDLPLEKEKILNIALNKIAGEWDEQKLAELLDELIKIPELVNVELTGFGVHERAQLRDH